MKNIIIILSLSLFYFSCDSSDDLTFWVKEDIIETWNGLGWYGEYKISDFLLIHKSGQEYKGLLEGEWVNDYGVFEPFSLTVEVIYDGNAFMWEIPEMLEY